MQYGIKIEKDVTGKFIVEDETGGELCRCKLYQDAMLIKEALNYFSREYLERQKGTRDYLFSNETKTITKNK